MPTSHSGVGLDNSVQYFFGRWHSNSYLTSWCRFGENQAAILNGEVNAAFVNSLVSWILWVFSSYCSYSSLCPGGSGWVRWLALLIWGVLRLLQMLLILLYLSRKRRHLFNEQDDVARGQCWDVCSSFSVTVSLFGGVGAGLLLSFNSVLCMLEKWPWRVLHLCVTLVWSDQCA